MPTYREQCRNNSVTMLWSTSKQWPLKLPLRADSKMTQSMWAVCLQAYQMLLSVSVCFSSQLCVTKWRHQTHGSRAFACHESHAGFYQILLLVFRVLKILQTCGGLNFSTINHKRINKERDRRTDKCLDIHPNISIPAENASIHRCTVYYTSDITQILWLQICDDTDPPLW